MTADQHGWWWKPSRSPHCHDHCPCQKMKLNKLKALLRKLGVVLLMTREPCHYSTCFKIPVQSRRSTRIAAHMKERQHHCGTREWAKVGILIGCEIKLPPGFDRSGAQIGFFAHMNRDYVPGAQNKSYLMEQSEEIKQPKFAPKPRKSTTNDISRRPSCPESHQTLP